LQNQQNPSPPGKKSMIASISKELCLGSLRNVSVVYIMVNWGLIFTADIKRGSVDFANKYDYLNICENKYYYT
jgi:hypothetical protein